MMSFLLLLLGISPAAAVPYTPANETLVLERLVSGPARGSYSVIRREQAALAQRPQDLVLACALARRCIALGRAEADPRFYGFAQAALAPWWGQKEPPVDILMLRAVIRQAGHEFDAALADLDEIVRREPGLAQGWLTRAVVLQARGDYVRAEQSCVNATRIAHASEAGLVCLWSVRSFRGYSHEALRALAPALGARSTMGRDARLWALAVAADVTRRLGDRERAQRGYRLALGYQPGDPFLLAAYSDLLLDMNQYDTVVSLLKPYRQNGNLLLRIGIAERSLGRSEWKEVARTLDTLFAASRLRGDNLHRREEARFTLALQDDPRRALSLAQQNWRVQREPEDLRILIESAVAARDEAALKTARDWWRQSRLEDVEVERLLQ